MKYKEDIDSSGRIFKEWRNELGDLHREDGPAYIYYYEDGSLSIEEFRINGMYHRLDGPAQIGRFRDGSTWENFYIDGEYLGRDKEGFWALWDKLSNQQRQSQALLRYLMRYS